MQDYEDINQIAVAKGTGFYLSLSLCFVNARLYLLISGLCVHVLVGGPAQQES